VVLLATLRARAYSRVKFDTLVKQIHSGYDRDRLVLSSLAAYRWQKIGLNTEVRGVNEGM
jgi:hypothetical protein